MKKIVKLRGPDGFNSDVFESSDDDWHPMAGQDFHLVDALLGPGAYKVAGTRAVYSGKPAVTDLAARYAVKVDRVFLKHVEVFLESSTTGAAQVPVTEPAAFLPAQPGRNVRKVIKMRGPDGQYADFFETGLDDWQPTPLQDFALVDALHGAGWYTVAACRVVYATSDAHTDVAARLGGLVSRIQIQHMEVFLEEKNLEAAAEAHANRDTTHRPVNRL